MENETELTETSIEWEKWTKLKEKLGEVVITESVAKEIIYKLQFGKEFHNQEIQVLTQLIRDNVIDRAIWRRNILVEKHKEKEQKKTFSKRIKDLNKEISKHIRQGNKKQKGYLCKNCSEKLYPLSYRKNGSGATVVRISEGFYCLKCDEVFIVDSDTTPKINAVKKETDNSIEIDLLEGCTDRTKKIIKLLVKEFGYSPMGFEVNIGKKLQRKGHQDIYYMGKHITNNRITRLLNYYDSKEESNAQNEIEKKAEENLSKMARGVLK